MTQTIVHAFPPLFDEIDAAFKVRSRAGVFYSFGDVIYCPDGAPISPEFLAHEAVHGRRQGSGARVLEWWRRYIDDPKFRLAEEIPAHVAEYRWLVAHGNRGARRAAAGCVAARLSSPLYGRMIGRSAALHMLRALP